VKPGFLNNLEVIEWLGGVEPVWACLEFDSFCRLQLAPGEPDAAISLAHDLTASELSAAPVIRCALLMLEAADAPGGLKLTASGNLSRVAIMGLAPACDWPGFGLQQIMSRNKQVNEAEVFQLRYLRLLLTDLQLLRKKGGALFPTARGRAALAARGAGDLLARMFEETFWRFDLGVFDGCPFEDWPQSEAALTLWCLAAGANIWERPERLARLAATPAVEVLHFERDIAGLAMELRILRFLTIFGVLEARAEPSPPGVFWTDRRLYRKTQFCDRFLSFDVEVEPPAGPIH
jgi:hypothetical protein